MKREHALRVRPHGLTMKERAFCEHYVDSGNATQSAIKAGYSVKSAEKNAGLILRRPHVMAFVKIKIEERFAAERMTNEEIIARIARIARMDIRGMFDEAGKLKPISALTAEEAYAIRGFETKVNIPREGDPEEITKVKLADPLAALALAARINKLTSNENKQLNVFIDLDARMDRARKRKAIANTKATDVESRVVSDQ